MESGKILISFYRNTITQKIEGFEVQVFKDDGNKYQCFYNNGIRNGIGYAIWPDGGTYSG